MLLLDLLDEQGDGPTADTGSQSSDELSSLISINSRKMVKVSLLLVSEVRVL